MDNGPRIFAYTTTVTVVALAVVVLTEKFLTFIDAYGWQKWAAIAAYALVYFNLSISFNRRFIAKAPDGGPLAYMLGGIFVIPPGVWMFLRDIGAFPNRMLFLLIALLACLLGAHWGIKLGLKTRTKYATGHGRQQDVPQDLHNAHKRINKN